MPPKSAPNPTPKTESAREALKSFFCELCQKGYSRINEFEAHESSYDHQHKKRLKEMKQMHREPLASKARRAERKADARAGLVSIKMDLNPSNTTGGASSSGGGGGGGGGFKKGGFKNAFVGTEAGTMSDNGGLMDAGKAPREADVVPSVEKEVNEREEEDEESDLEGGEDAYDPRRPTGCHPGCPGWDF